MFMQLLIKRICWMIPILFFIHLFTFVLFFVVNSPDDIARAHLGQKYVTPTEINLWKKSFGLDKPLFWDGQVNGLGKITDTVFFNHTLELLQGNLGKSLNGGSINQQIKERGGASLAIAFPSFILGTIIYILMALILVYFRHTHLNQIGLITTICFLSVSTLFYIIFAQYYFAFLWKWFPISGYLGGFNAIYFVMLPIIVHIFSGIGSGTRWCRTLLMEEIEQAYVVTAKAMGLKESVILIFYVLRNALLPLSTAIIVMLPSLFLGSMLFESFFAIPGLGNYLITALNQQDFIAVRAMVFIGSLAYLIGLLITDIFYLYIDPRVRFI
jgi:peptide/nickel transport system permease protein